MVKKLHALKDKKSLKGQPADPKAKADPEAKANLPKMKKKK